MQEVEQQGRDVQRLDHVAAVDEIADCGQGHQVNAQILGRFGVGEAQGRDSFGEIGGGDVVLQGRIGRQAAERRPVSRIE